MGVTYFIFSNLEKLWRTYREEVTVIKMKIHNFTDNKLSEFLVIVQVLCTLVLAYIPYLYRSTDAESVALWRNKPWYGEILLIGHSSTQFLCV